MSEDEVIVRYLLQVDEVVKEIIGLGEELEESMVVKNILRSLPKAYTLKVFSIEEDRDLDKILVDQLYCALSIFEMRYFEKEYPKKEETFKSSKQDMYETTYESSDTDDEEEKFVMKLKRVSVNLQR